MSETFLSRWSKRKFDEQNNAERSAPSVVESAQADEPDPDAITPEELAALPALESVTSAEELTVFLRKGIPAVLRMAALKKLWVLDPAIRDYVGDARDYAWDWNVPGGVPVSGPIEPGADIESMVRKIFGDDSLKPPVRENVIAEQESAQPPSPVNRRVPQPSQQPEIEETHDDVGRKHETISRRHGGALPA